MGLILPRLRAGFFCCWGAIGGFLGGVFLLGRGFCYFLGGRLSGFILFEGGFFFRGRRFEWYFSI